MTLSIQSSKIDKTIQCDLGDKLREKSRKPLSHNTGERLSQRERERLM